MRARCGSSISTTGHVIGNLLALEDRRDVGDLYTPALRETLPPWKLRRVRRVHRGPLRGELAVDYAGASGRCTLRLQLDANLPALRIRVEGENRGKDHRLRLRFMTELAGAATIADAAFYPVSREPLKLSEDEQRMEHVVASAPLHRWVARMSTSAGATIFSDGLAEYESHRRRKHRRHTRSRGRRTITSRSAGAAGERRLACGHTGCTIARPLRGGVRRRAARPGLARRARLDRAAC